MRLSIALSVLTITFLNTCANARVVPDARRSLQYDPAVYQALGNLSYGFPPMNNPNFTCTVLEIAFDTSTSGTVVTASDGSKWKDLEDDNYSSTCWLPAACIVSPANADDVARSLQIVGSLETKFAVRSGGHKDTPGFASIDGSGVLISLEKLNGLNLSDDKSTFTIGPGNRWEAVYRALANEGLFVIGGRVGIVGVGGFLLGGGVNYFANQYGLALDNIKSYQIALGNGSIITASVTENSDLYKGLRGGGTNFGVVTAYELYTYAIDTVYFEALAYDLNQTSEFLSALAKYQETGESDRKASVTIQMQENGPFILLCYLGAADKPAAFDAFYNISPYTQYVAPVNGTLKAVLSLSAASFPSGNIRFYGETYSHRFSANYSIDAYEIFAAEIANLPSGATGTWVPTAISDYAISQSDKFGGNVLGLEPVSQLWHEWFIMWTDTSQDEEIYTIAASITEKVVAAAEDAGVLLPYIFMNTAGNTQNVLGSFGEDNVAFIKKVAAKYDPAEVFQKYQNKGYLIRDL